MATIPTYDVAKGCGRVIEFRIKGSGGYQDLTTLLACDVVVDDAAGARIYTANCPPKAGENTIRLATIASTATATAGLFNACVHWTDAAGVTDAERFRVSVYEHAV